jgi:hypothetical protein
MPFDITTFRSALNRDGARPNLFEVKMNFPAAVVVGSGEASRELTFMCRSAQLPGSSVGSVVVPYFGREVKFVGNRTFADWTITIINDEDFVIKNAFERWMGGINSHFGNRRNSSFANPTSYTTDAEVVQYGKTGNRIKNYQFIGMFPIDISPIDVDWGANDTIEEFSVTLQYQYWISNTTDRVSSGAVQPAGER